MSLAAEEKFRVEQRIHHRYKQMQTVAIQYNSFTKSKNTISTTASAINTIISDLNF